MEKQTYDKPLFKVHLIPLANGGPGCNIKALAEETGCPVYEPGVQEVLFTDSIVGCETIMEKEEAQFTFGLCYHVPESASTIFWS